MRQRLAILGIAGAVLLGSAGSAEAAGKLKVSERKAARAASGYVERFGIFYPPKSWDATCNRKGARKWKCRVETDTGQCRGTLRLREKRGGGFKADRKRIGCGE